MLIRNYEKYNFPKIGYIKLPRIKIPQEDIDNLKLSNNTSSEEYLLKLVKNNFDIKLKNGIIPANNYVEYWKRIEFELNEINKLFFTDYILLIYHIIRFCKQNNILNGYGRGSCVGSLLLYVLDVVKVDAIKHNLLFERFISSGRTEVKTINGEIYIKSENLPDVDIDSDRNLKYKINEFITSQFPNRTASIKTVGTLQGKSAIKEVLKIYEEYSEDQAKEISDLIEVRFGKVEEIKDAMSDKADKENKKFKEWAKLHMGSVKIACKLNGLIKNFSVHASGIILCEEELDKVIPLELSAESNGRKPVTAYEMGGAQLFGVKIDNLGLKNLSSIKECLDLTNNKIENINVDDVSVYNFLQNSNDYRGIFQAEEGLGKSVMKKLKCNNVDDIGMSVAIGRPGSMKFLDEIVHSRETGEIRDIDTRIQDILSPTQNVIVYQEQIMALSRRMANFTPQEADGLRKGIGKKIKEKVIQYKDKFIKGSIENGFKKELAEEMFKVFEDSGDYLFNKSHALAYGYLSAACAYLKANYPTEFFYSLLKNAKNESKPQEEISAISEELSNFGIQLLGPDILKSGDDFTIEGKNKIRMGLGNIKGISDKALIKLRNFCHIHSNKFEIFKAADECGISIAILANLILAGAMDEYIYTTRTAACKEMQTWNLLTPREQKMVISLGEKFGYNLNLILKHLRTLQPGSAKPFINDKRVQTIKKNYYKIQKMYEQNSKNEDLCCYIMERSLLGFSYSRNLIDIIKKDDAGIDTITIKEATSLPNDEIVTVCGEILSVKNGKSKKNNKYIKCVVSDGTGSVNIMLMENKFEQNILNNKGSQYEGGQIVMARGRKGSDIIFCDTITIQNIKIISKLSEIKEI